MHLNKASVHVDMIDLLEGRNISGSPNVHSELEFLGDFHDVLA